MIKKISFFIGLLLFILSFGQKKEQLQQQNADLKKQISSINKDLAKTQSQSKLSLAYLNNVNSKIVLREKVYTNTQKQKKLIDDDIYLRQLEINRQNKALVVLRKNYADVLVNAYKNKGVQNKITFILSSKSIGEAIRRGQYLNQYADYQERKSQEIANASMLIKSSISAKQKSANDKEILLQNQQKDLLTINAEKKQKEILLQDFKKNEARLTGELKQKQAESKALEGKIRSIIAEEIKIAKAREETERKAEAEKIRLAKIASDREKARIDAESKVKLAALAEAKRKADVEAKRLADIATKKAEDEKRRTEDALKADASERDKAKKITAEKESALAASAAKAAAEKAAFAKAEEIALNKKNDDAKKAAESKALTNFGVAPTLTSNFSSSKGRIGRPVEGPITHKFGRQQHPLFKNIVEENNGIKIAATSGAKAKCVFPGIVSRIIVAGGTKTVMVKHGDYFTVYSNLENTFVSQNQPVAAGSPIGTIAQDYDGSYTLDFQIWNGSTPVDPLSWISY